MLVKTHHKNTQSLLKLVEYSIISYYYTIEQRLAFSNYLII